MILRNKYIAVLFFILPVILGFLCLNLHSLTHLKDWQPGSHQTGSDSLPANKISDDCVLCLVSASGSADLKVQAFNTVQTETEQILYPSFTSPTHQTVSATSPRAPPVS